MNERLRVSFVSDCKDLILFAELCGICGSRDFEYSIINRSTAGEDGFVILDREVLV